jgi:pyruvyltransferase
MGRRHVAGLEVFHWNPRKPVLPGRLARVPLGRRVNNFGDLIGPMVVELMLRRRNLTNRPRAANRKLMSVGSVMHFADTGDVVWGTGVNGKMPAELHRFSDLDVRAVRGPMTRNFLVERGISVPEVYGDPALLLPLLMPEMSDWAKVKAHRVTVIPNLNDVPDYLEGGVEFLHPRSPLLECLERIARSELVVGSSLHGIVVAESLGVPARLVGSRIESQFKYADYYAGTGRTDFTAARTVEEAVTLGGEPPVSWSPEALVDAFPYDVWS